MILRSLLTISRTMTPFLAARFPQMGIVIKWRTKIE